MLFILTISATNLKFPRKNREQAMQQIIQRYAERLQTYCLKEPLQWFNFFDFWHVDNDDNKKLLFSMASH